MEFKGVYTLNGHLAGSFRPVVPPLFYMWVASPISGVSFRPWVVSPVSCFVHHYYFIIIIISSSSSRHFQLNPILILEFDIGVRIIFLMDILKDNV